MATIPNMYSPMAKSFWSCSVWWISADGDGSVSGGGVSVSIDKTWASSCGVSSIADVVLDISSGGGVCNSGRDWEAPCSLTWSSCILPPGAFSNGPLQVCFSTYVQFPK